MEISAPQPGWAEQDPDLWWDYVVKTTKTLLEESKVDPFKVTAVGISYQMHGLVIVDHDYKPLRPAIIWCDSRAIDIGDEVANTIGVDRSLEHHLNTPGNFTASKLAWVKAHEPEVYQKIAAYAAIGAAGFGLVASLKGAGGGGSTGGSASTPIATPTAQEQQGIPGSVAR